MTKRRNTARRLRVAFILACVIVGSAVGFTSNTASGAEVSARVTVQPYCSVSVGDGYAVVRSNTAWKLAVVAADGESRSVDGSPTNGSRVKLGPGEHVEMVAR